jgi:hypothetical protein
LAITPHGSESSKISSNQETTAMVKKAENQIPSDAPSQKHTDDLDGPRKSKESSIAHQRFAFKFLTSADTAKLLSAIPSPDCQIAVYYPIAGGLDSNLMAFEVGRFLRLHYKNVTTSFEYIDMGYSYLDSIRYVNNKLKLIVYPGGIYGICRVQIWLYHKTN